jgi:hypothetical protein
VRNLKKREGAVLALTLVVMVFGIAFAGAAFYLVENMFSTTMNVVRDMRLNNIAEGGIEIGKEWLESFIESENRLPRLAGDIEGKIDVPDELENLRVKHFPLAPASADSAVELEVEIYDLKYGINAIDTGELTPGKIFPPQLNENMIEYIGSRHLFSSYSASNRSEGSAGAGFGTDNYGAYLVRSRAVFGTREKVLSEAVLRKLRE